MNSASPVICCDRPDLDAGLVHRHQQVGEAPVALRLRVGARQHEAPVGPLGPARSRPSGRRSPTRRRRARRASARWRGRSRRRARSSPDTRSRRRRRSAAGSAASAPRCRRRSASGRAASRRCGSSARARPRARTPRGRSPAASRLAPRPPYSVGQPTQVQPPAASCFSQARRSSMNAVSSPGPPRPRSTANSPASAASSHAATSRRNASSSALKWRFIGRNYDTLRLVSEQS